MKQLDPNTVSEIAKRLSRFLADTSVLYIKTLNFHWNMVGPQFFMYHKLLQEQYEEMAEAIDDLAERIRGLGHPAPGSMKDFLELATLKESTSPLSQDEMVNSLIKDHESLESQLHEQIAFTEEALDQGTADLLVERIRFHSKQAWLLRSNVS